MNTIWMTYLAAAAVASGLFLVAGWRSKQALTLTSGDYPNGMPHDALWADAEIDLTATQSEADVAGAIRLALKRLAPLMTSHFVQADLAAPSGLLARMRGARLTDLMEELLAAAIQGAPASRLLITAASRGERIYVSVTDDMPGVDPVVRSGGLRGLMQTVAMRGGALDVDVRPTEGTTMTLRLAAVTEPRPCTSAQPAPPAITTLDSKLIPSISNDRVT